jgi:hypothetical protein
MARAEKAIDPADFTGIPRTRGATNEYPLTVSAGKTQTLPLWFELKDYVKETFKTPAELRVYYRNGREESVAHAFIVGGPLDMKTPSVRAN